MSYYPVHTPPDRAAVYLIQIQGQIGEHWTSFFDDFEITVTGKGRTAITTLTGPLCDQAALQGVLQHLYSLGLVLLRVEREEA